MLYPVPLPSALGTEAAGVVEEVGPDVTDVKPGNRVGYAVDPLSGIVKIEIKQTHPLKKTAQAHRDLESRKTIGPSVLIVGSVGGTMLRLRLAELTGFTFTIEEGFQPVLAAGWRAQRTHGRHLIRR
jgi:hypothetical protein